MRRRTLGTLLHSADKAEVLAAYVYRNTVENRKVNEKAVQQAWSGKAPEPVTDAEWLATHTFAVKKDGRLDSRSTSARPWNPGY